MSKSQRAISTDALEKLLDEVIDEPALWSTNQDFIDALKVQGKLAKWRDDERRITPCSLNTLKTSAEETLRGGYPALDELRKRAVGAIQAYLARHEGPKPGTKAHVEERNKELERQVTILEQQNAVLVDIICTLKQNAAKYAQKAPGLTRAQCEKEMRGVEARINFSGNRELFKALEEAEKEQHDA